MRSLMLQRLCSSYASGLATAEKLLAGRSLEDEELELELGDEGLSLIDEERRHLQRRWLELGCIIFSQYFDTTKWIAEGLTGRPTREPVAVYAGAGNLHQRRVEERRTRADQASRQGTHDPAHCCHRRRMRGPEPPDAGDPDQRRSSVESFPVRATHRSHQTVRSAPGPREHAQSPLPWLRSAHGR